MHSIVTTFRGAVIKVEVANFCAAMDTLIDQDGALLKSSLIRLLLHYLSFNLAIFSYVRTCHNSHYPQACIGLCLLVLVATLSDDASITLRKAAAHGHEV